jgi:methionyl-tRNA formyltransferase
MGTPEFAVDSLKNIINAGYEVVGVVTAPDKPAGRGKKITQSAVKILAMNFDLPVLQPTNLKDEKFVEEFRALNANVGVVVAFRMLPEVIWSMPAFGTFNLHASLLPNYRGAAPIHRAIMNGEKETGVTTFFLKHEIDTGDVIFQEKVKIGDDETTGELYERLKVLGGELVLKTLKSIQEQSYVLKNQNDLVTNDDVIYSAPKIEKEDTTIDWKMPAYVIVNKIRGLNPVPGANTKLFAPNGKEYFLKVYKSTAIYDSSIGISGEVETDGKSYLIVNSGNGKVKLEELQIQGRRKVNIIDFLNGFELTDKWLFL